MDCLDQYDLYQQCLVKNPEYVEKMLSGEHKGDADFIRLHLHSARR